MRRLGRTAAMLAQEPMAVTQRTHAE